MEDDKLSPRNRRRDRDFVSSEILDIIDDVSRKVTAMQRTLEQDPKKAKEVEETARIEFPHWGEWEKLNSHCQDFDKYKVQHVLIASTVPHSDFEYIGKLQKVPWRAIIDLDPDSEEKGLYRAFRQDEDQRTLIEPWVPEHVLELKSGDLGSAIDWRKTPWLFANGRTKDSTINQPPKTFKEWQARWLSAISLFLKVLVENLDQHKPFVTFALPFELTTAQYLRVLLTRLDQELSSRYFTSVEHLIINSSAKSSLDEKHLSDVCNAVRTYHLPLNLLSLGVNVCLGCAPPKAKMMPTAVSGIHVPLKESDFLFLSEYLTLMYHGCENEELSVNPDALREEQIDKIVDEHKEAFLSGQSISLLSLAYDHDARRDVLDEFRTKIQKHLYQKPVALSTAIELVHQPGTGGSTLAKRAVWELRSQHPCAIVNQRMTVRTPDEEDNFISAVRDRIWSLEELCGTAPLILLDGESSVFRRSSLSRIIAERLSSRGGKAAILHCLRGTEISAFAYEKSPHISFCLDDKLSREEKKKFEEKYGQPRDPRGPLARGKNPPLCRTFHFPLCAFLDKFKAKMEEIVSSSLDELDEPETQVVLFVALMQKYGGRSVPASLILRLFLKDLSQVRRRITGTDTDEFLTCSPSYDEIYSSLSQNLRLLLVQSGTERVRGEEYVCYDLQHVVVADSVLKKLFGAGHTYYSRLEQCLERLLDLDGLRSVDQKFLGWFEDLFLHNKNGDHKMRFAVLVETLKKHASPERAGELLRKAASVFPSVRFYSHVARYFLYSRPHNYALADEMITAGFKALRPNESKGILHDVRGLLYRIRMSEYIEEGKVRSLEHLEKMAGDAIREYSNAITVPPKWPNPLVGKVQVWLKCLDWIVEHCCDKNVVRVVEFLSRDAPEFFRNCLSDAFYHIEVIEQLLVMHSLADGGSTSEKVADLKMKLCFVKAKSHGVRSPSRSASPGNRLLLECKKLSRNPELEYHSQRELRRLKVYYLMYRDGVVVRLAALTDAELLYLFKVLQELVEQDKEHRFISNLFRVASHLPGKEGLPLDDCIHLARVWQKASPFDPFPHFYLSMFYFLKVLDGRVVECGAKYEEAMQKCKDLSQLCNTSYNSFYYLSKRGSGLSSLVERSALPLQTTDEFWQQKSRDTLRELEGRIKVKAAGHKRQRSRTYIELINSGLHVFVGRYHGIGELGRDYHVDQLVKFVVSFTMRNPTAHGLVIK